MTDALLLLLDRNAHPGTLADTEAACMQLKGVTHVHALPVGATVDVAAYRERLEAALARMDAEREYLRERVREAPVEVYDDGA